MFACRLYIPYCQQKLNSSHRILFFFQKQDNVTRADNTAERERGLGQDLVRLWESYFQLRRMSIDYKTCGNPCKFSISRFGLTLLASSLTLRRLPCRFSLCLLYRIFCPQVSSVFFQFSSVVGRLS